jgi:hypothetical protein
MQLWKTLAVVAITLAFTAPAWAECGADHAKSAAAASDQVAASKADSHAPTFDQAAARTQSARE